MANEAFSVGEMATIHMPGTNMHGVECEVIEPARERSWKYFADKSARTGIAYVVRFAGYERFVIRPNLLRKRGPPQDWVKLCHLTNLPREVIHV